MQLTLDRFLPKEDLSFRCWFLYAVWKVFISFCYERCHSHCETPFSLVSSKKTKKLELFSLSPILFLVGQRRDQVQRMRSNHSSLKYLIRNLLALISAVSNSTKAGDNTTSETAKAPTVSTTEALTVSRTDAPFVLQSVQGLWFCHAHY